MSGHAKKWYFNKAEPVVENLKRKHEILIQVERPDVVIINNEKKACQIMDLAVPE